VRIPIPAAILEDIVDHARACSPQEGCGFLVGRSGSVDRFVPAPNILQSASAFEVDPVFLFDLFRGLRSSGEELVAIYHSHPNGPAIPSQRDVAHAHYPDAAQVIVSLAGVEPEVKAYRIAGKEVLEAELHAIV
jgi:proteasome lid subunit RPN8/RPN11